MDRKHTVFICSTFIDLQKERQLVFEALYKNGFIPIGMEGFTPGHKSQMSYIRDRIDECDYFIIIAAHRFGTPVPNSDGKTSITEYEYDYALSKKDIPICRFVISDDAPWPGSAIYRASNKDSVYLQRFKKKLGEPDYDLNFWNQDNLVEKIITNLNAVRISHPKSGLIRSTPVVQDAEKYQIDRIFSGLRGVDKKDVMVGHKILWIVMNDGYSVIDYNLKYIKEAAASGANIKIMLIHPESPFIEAIAEKSNKSKDVQINDIMKSVRLIHSEFGDIPNLKVFGHKFYNSYSAFVNEDFCLVDFYFNYRLENKRQDDRVALRCLQSGSNDALYWKIYDDFDYLWRSVESKGDSNLYDYIK